jgi:hypothetical protein
MTVNIASTTDTEAEVAEALNVESVTENVPVEATTQAEATPQAEPDAEIDDAVDETLEATPSDDDVEVGDRQDSDKPYVEASSDDDAPKRKRRRRGRSYKDRASQLAREKAIEKSRADSLEAQLAAYQKDQVKAPAPAEPAAPRDSVTAAAPPSATAAPPSATAAPPSATAAPADGRPAQEDFETYDAFQEAVMDWKVQTKIAEHEAGRARIERESAQQRAQETLVATHSARIDAFRSEHEDFDAVVERGKDLPITRPMQDAVLNSDVGPGLMYHLCQHPEECDRISEMHPMMAIKEMGKLEARIEAAQTGPVSSAETVTRAPRPIKPVGGGATASTVPLDQLPYQEFKRMREKQLENQGR